MFALSSNLMPGIAFARERKTPRPRVSGMAPVNPLAEDKWDESISAHPGATFFHTTAWARVLHGTYGHTPVYFTNRWCDPSGSLLPVMEVNSVWLGRRGVSLPFADRCAPLSANPEDAEELFNQALEYGRARGWRSFETRGGVGLGRGSAASVAYFGHTLDLAGGEKHLFDSMDSAVRRSIRKAEASSLSVEWSSEPLAMQEYYSLHCRTRRRHGLPPQPYSFFDAILRHVLKPGHGSTVLARKGGRLAAGAIFFQHGAGAIYKFGASDVAYHEHRPNNLILWEAIKYYAGRGCGVLDLGRTSLGNDGLRRFKLGFGASEERLEYCRFDYEKGRFMSGTDRSETWLNNLFGMLPVPALRLVGAWVYPHLA